MTHFSLHQASLKRALWMLAGVAEKWCAPSVQCDAPHVAKTGALECTEKKP
jgi:hypothetical protein